MSGQQSSWFWAKLGNETWPDRYHPVICHLIDVGQVAHALWRLALRKPVRDRVAEQLGLTCDDAGSWIAFWVGAHDIGKVTPCFQSQGKTQVLTTRLVGAGFGGGLGNPHHTVTGTKLLARALAAGIDGWPATDPQLSRKIAVAVGGHHGTFPSGFDYDETDSLGNEHWAAARREILSHLARLFEVTDLPAPQPPAGNDQSVWMFLAGLTAVADWIGSNVEFFPPAVSDSRPFDAPFDVDDYFRWSGVKAAEALQRLGWLGRAEPAPTPALFGKLFPMIEKTRPLQDKVIEIARDMIAPRLIIVEAPMGEGKTEAAWYVADCWDRRGGAGTYVALPTLATSNQMFQRVEKFLEAAAGKRHLQLLHGKAALNPDFEKLKEFAEQYDELGSPSAVVAEEWFAKDKKQALLAPYGVGTIDQVLLAVLQTKHAFVRLFGLAGKCVILDEVHAYDAYMTTLMERLLRWLAALGCPVVLLSATLPAEKRLKLLRAYAGDDTPEPQKEDYPRVTSVAVNGKPCVKQVAADEKRKKELSLVWVEDAELAGKLKETLADGGCAAVIRNTVGLAQETFERLRDGLKNAGIRVELFHARFPFGRRQQIETDVLNKFGKGADGSPLNPLRPERAILVATQVIEQSLDLDFDVMVTDVAPVDLVLQRAGRLHRHARGERPARVNAPKLWLIRPGEKDGRPDFGDSEWVYARFVLLRSLIALGLPRRMVTLPGELERLVEQVYGGETLDIPDGHCDDLRASEQEMREVQRKQGRSAKRVMIYRPDAEDLLEQPSQQLREDDPEAHEKVRAATRDTEPTIQLILVYHRDGRDSLDPDGTEPFDENETPDVAALRRLLNNEVTISHPGCVFHYAKRAVPRGWLKSGMLRHYRIARLSESGSAVRGEFPMYYRTESGVYLG